MFRVSVTCFMQDVGRCRAQSNKVCYRFWDCRFWALLFGLLAKFKPLHSACRVFHLRFRVRA